jgi:hypothetical protein
MKSYVIDELRGNDFNRIKDYADAHFTPSGIGGLYWITLDSDILSDNQKTHQACRPFYFAVEITPERVVCELLVRTNNRVRCSCIRYATENQLNWLTRLIDGVMESLDIKL